MPRLKTPVSHLKKEDEFYTMLRQLSETILEAAEEYVSIFREYPDSIARIPRMKVYETTCDEQVSAIHKRLYTSFITPFDREDISELALALDDVMDYMETSAVRLDLFNVAEMNENAVEMAELTLIAVRELHEMMDRLPNFQKDPLVMEKAIAVGHVEDNGDAVYRNALRAIFHEDEVHGRQAMAWIRIIDRMEHCINCCDHCAGVVRNVVMKSA